MASKRYSLQSMLTVQRRLAVVLMLAMLVFSLIGLRLVWVQVVGSDRLRNLALDQRLRPVPVDAKRGTVYDRNGRELAVSVSSDSIYAVPVEIKDPAATAKILAKTLGLNADTLLANLTKHASTVWVKRKVDPDAAMAVRKLNLPGIGFTESGQRFYPKDGLAAHVLGIAGVDNQGLEGLEKQYDIYLSGTRGRIEAERDAAGKEIPEGRHVYVPPVDGYDVYLTIDEVIQYIVERELDKAMADTKAKRGVIIAMDPRTGEILAMASRPTYNPNNYNDFPASFRRNIAVADSYEPGSTFKVITAAAALEEGVVTPTTEFYDPGYVEVEGHKLRCHKPGGHGLQTFVEAAENSCNPVFASIALKLGRDKLLEYIKAFGFGAKTGIDFPGEATGLLHSPKAMGPVEVATYGFGQGISVTPLQMVTALSAIANDGYLMRPMLVREIRSSNGETVKRFYPTKVRQVVSEKTAHELTQILESVVVNGSGARAYIPGYAVAGKTGTAQKPEQGRYGDKRVASFMGFAPANDPKVAIIVIIDEPNVGISYGGVLAAPVFKAIMEDVLRYLEIPPTYASGSEVGQGPAAEAKMVQVPELRGLDLDTATAELAKLRLVPRLEGAGEVVASQVPKPGAEVVPGTSVVLYFGQPPAADGRTGRVKVPDVRGMTMKEAAMALNAVGLGFIPTGSGTVVSQSPEPGALVGYGTVVRAKLE